MKYKNSSFRNIFKLLNFKNIRSTAWSLQVIKCQKQNENHPDLIQVCGKIDRDIKWFRLFPLRNYSYFAIWLLQIAKG